MENIDFNSIKRKIEKEKCSKHNQHPKVEKTAKGFNILACCEYFRSQMTKKMEKVMAEEIKSSIEKMLKKSFK
jgi:hypothetical protein